MLTYFEDSVIVNYLCSYFRVHWQMTRRCVFYAVEEHGIKEWFSPFILLIRGNGCQGPLPHCHPVGSFAITKEVFYLHTTEIGSKNPALQARWAGQASVPVSGWASAV